MTEFEKKLLLTKDEYHYVLDYFGQNKPHVKQINYYFDTDDLFMNHENTTCRIRLMDGKYEGTIKQHTKNSDHSTETAVEVRDGIYDNDFLDMGLKLQGEVVTERCVIFKDSICEVVLDKNEYLGYVDYELEIEYSPNHEKTALYILQMYLDHKKTYSHNSKAPSKSSRFFERKIKSIPNKTQIEDRRSL